jgi:hypothetical protein
MPDFVLFYAKYSIDRKKQVKHLGTFFGDSGDAEEVKNTGIEIRKRDASIIVIPKIYKLVDTLDSLSLNAQEFFEDFGNKLQEQQE